MRDVYDNVFAGIFVSHAGGGGGGGGREGRGKGGQAACGSSEGNGEVVAPAFQA